MLAALQLMNPETEVEDSALKKKIVITLISLAIKWGDYMCVSDVKN